MQSEIRQAKNKTPIVISLAAIVLLGSLAWWMTGAGRPASVKRVAHADPALQGAIRRAQSELDSFIAQLADPKPAERFAIKGAFPSAVGNEYLWVRDPVYKDSRFVGILDQTPIAYQAAAKGDKVTVHRSYVVDWLIKEGGQTRGGYTEQVLGGQNGK